MCGGGKGGSTTSTNNSTATQTPPDYLNTAYQDLVSQAQQTASGSFNPSTIASVAPFNSTQGTAFGEVAGAQGAANPYISAAANSIGASQTPLWGSTQQFSPSNVQSYEDPYSTDVVNATMAEINQQNAQQQSQLQGNAASQHALGGDRSGIAAASLANQQGLAANQTLAQLNNQDYSQALGELNTEQQTQLGANEAQGWLNSQAGSGYANLGNEALNSSLTGAQALLATGNQQQRQQQSGLTYGANEAAGATGYPFQTSQYLANILEGIGGVAGGTTSGTSTNTQNTSGGSILSQILGGGAGLAGILGETGAFGDTGYLSSLFGGSTPDYSSYASNLGVSNLANSSSSATSALNNTGFLGSSVPSTYGLQYGGYSSGGIARQRYAGGGLTGQSPNADVSIIPIVPASGVHADFPSLPSPPSQGGGGGSGSSGGGLGDVASLASSAASIAAMFKNGGVARQGYAGGGGLLGIKTGGMGSVGNSFGSMSAAHHTMPRITLPKTPNLLTVPKFDDGGTVGGIGGLMPSASTENPLVQNANQRFSQYPAEKLRELSARFPPTSSQGQLIQHALTQKQIMPNTGQPQSMTPPASSATAGGLQVPSILTGQSGFANGGVSRETFDDGGSPTGGSPDAAMNYVVDADNGTMASAPSPGISPSRSAPPATHYQAPTPQQADPWQALMQAGFATMAGNSRDPLVNIGKGAMAGAQEYAKDKNDAAERTYKSGQVDDAVDKLNQEADFHVDALNNEQQKIDLETNKDANQAKYQQGLLDWRNNQTDKGKSGAVESLANRIMDETSDDQGNPTISFEEALSRAKASGATGVQSQREDGLLRKNAVDMVSNRIINEATGKPYTMNEALGFYGVPNGSAAPKPTSGTAIPQISAGALTQPSGSQSKSIPMPPPPVGAIIKGFQYLGGDPSQQGSWKAQ